MSTPSTPSTESERYPPPLIFPSAPHPTSALIFLHGRGDNAQQFSQVFALYSPGSSDTPLFALLPTTKLIFPRCSITPTRDGYSRIHQWFDLVSFDEADKLDDDHIIEIRECIAYIHRVVQDVIDSGIPIERIFLGGISQGGCAAMLAALTGKWRFAGLLSVSARMLWSKDIREEVFEAAGKVDGGEMDVGAEAEEGVRVEVVRKLARRLGMEPEGEETVGRVLRNRVWIGHSDDDRVVKFDQGLRVWGAMTALGMDVGFVRYTEAGHWYKVPEEIDDIVGFMEESGVL